jgi:hypothetical protein
MTGKRRCDYIIKTNLKEMRVSVDWSHLMPYRDQWRTNVNTSVKLLLPQKAEISRPQTHYQLLKNNSA